MADAAHMDAIRPLGHAIRQERARIREELKSGKRGIASVLVTPPPVVQTLTIERALSMIPRMGERKITRLLTHAQVSHRRKVGALTDRERQAILRGICELNPVVAGRRKAWRQD